MKKKERFFYIAVIVIQFAFIVFSLAMSIKASKEAANKKPPQRLCSFYGLDTGPDTTGQKSLIHFTTYSGKYYIFLVLSGDCRHCDAYVDNLGVFHTQKEEDSPIEVVVLLNGPDRRIAKTAPYLKILQIAHEDMFQFGAETPAILLVNGKGDLLYKHPGYQEGLFEKTLAMARQAATKKSKAVKF